MKTNWKICLSALILIAQTACGAASTSNENGYSATVKSVHDGDTVRVVDANGQTQRVRLAYIDAPELNQADGKSSRDALRKIVAQQKVRVEVFDTDQYGRQVARIYANGQDVNLLQIQQGNAWHYRSIAKRNQAKTDYAQYEAAEQSAKQQRLGLWTNRQAIAPWQYRYNQRQSEQ